MQPVNMQFRSTRVGQVLFYLSTIFTTFGTTRVQGIIRVIVFVLVVVVVVKKI